MTPRLTFQQCRSLMQSAFGFTWMQDVISVGGRSMKRIGSTNGNIEVVSGMDIANLQSQEHGADEIGCQQTLCRRRLHSSRALFSAGIACLNIPTENRPTNSGHGNSYALPCLAGQCRNFSQDTLKGGGAEEVPQSSRSWPEGRDFENIRSEIVAGGQVGLITLIRPKVLNALSEASMHEILEALRAMDKHAEVGATVIAGEGKAFAAGADIKEMSEQTFVDAYMGNMLGGWDEILNIRKPIIAAVNGYALGGGCELAMMCDIILAGERAMFGQPEVKLGVLPGMGGTQRLIRAVGKSRAMELILTGENFMNAEEAYRRGLASRVVLGDNATLVHEAVVLAKKIAEKSKPVTAMAKEAINTAYEMGLREGIKKERSLFHATFGLDDQKEGMAAFLGKRDPHFHNK